jgi:hypothetical protein
MTEFKWFKSLSTGKIGKYPEHFASRPSFVEVESEDASCIDCMVTPTADEDELIDVEEYDEPEILDEYEDVDDDEFVYQSPDTENEDK